MKTMFFSIDTIVDEDKIPILAPKVKGPAAMLKGYSDQPEFEYSHLPEAVRIIGIHMAGNDLAPSTNWGNKSAEAELLTLFWKWAERATKIVGFGCSYFDLPVILIRSAALGIEPTQKFFEFKPWDNILIDIADRRYGRQYQGRLSLNTLRSLLLPLLDIPSASQLDYEDVVKKYKAGEDLAPYATLKIETIRALAKLWGSYFFPRVLRRPGGPDEP